MMDTARHIGHIGTRMTLLMASAALVAAATAPSGQPPTTVSTTVNLAADSTALLVCGTTCPTWHQAQVDILMDQFITPTHPDQTITPVAVTTPQEYWPVTGLMRLIEFAVGDPRMAGPGGPAWPDEPWWKLSGLFDLTINQSIRAGVVDLEAAMADHDDGPLVIYGYSQGAAVAVEEKRKLAEQYPVGTTAPDISFVLGGDTNLPNGGLNARFPGLYIPILDLSFNGPEPTNTQFHTDVITRQYDGAADFPLYPLNVISTLNAVLGFVYLHTWPFDVSLASDSTPIVSDYGDTTYYFFETKDLPLFAPLRTLGVPEPVIDVVEPFFRVIVELGYDRTIPAGEPTPARLFPTKLDPVKVATDLVDAVGEGLNNAAALVRSPSAPAPDNVNTESVAVDHIQRLPAGDSAPQPDKPAGRPAKTRGMMRDLLTASTRVLGRSLRGEHGKSTRPRGEIKAEGATDTSPTPRSPSPTSPAPTPASPAAASPSGALTAGPVARAGKRALHRAHTKFRNATTPADGVDGSRDTP